MSRITVPIELELTPRSRAVMNALGRVLNPRFVDFDEPAAEPPAARSAVQLPWKPGTHWPAEDGWYAGPILPPSGDLWHLIVPTAHIHALADVQWGGRGTEVEGADDMHDGEANTDAMAAADLDLAKRVRSLGEGLYLPARAEALLMFATLKAAIGDGVIWTSTQYSADHAWFQDFGYGDQLILYKDAELRAVPVRRLFL
jgi:hypothetical protein